MDILKHPSLEKEIRGIRVGLIRNNPIIAKGKQSESNEELVSWHREKTPWSKARVDLTGPINEITYLVLADSHSMWSEVIPGPSQSNKAAIHALDHIFATYGPPKTTESQNTTQFTSSRFEEYCRYRAV